MQASHAIANDYADFLETAAEEVRQLCTNRMQLHDIYTSIMNQTLKFHFAMYEALPYGTTSNSVPSVK